MELAIRTAMTKLGASLPEKLLAADVGYRGPRADYGAGHQAVSVSYRAKTFDTWPGGSRLSRAKAATAPAHHVAGSGSLMQAYLIAAQLSRHEWVMRSFGLTVGHVAER